MSNALRKGSLRFIVSDYQGWPADERWELIHGEAYDMSPAPTPEHQQITADLFQFISGALKEQGRSRRSGGGCTLFFAPIDVILASDTVVQPDIVVVCDPAKIGPKAIEGAPDLVVEVLSPSTASKDHIEKRALYEASGVMEYLIVDGEAKRAYLFQRQPGGGFGPPQGIGPEGVLEVLGLHTSRTLADILGWPIQDEA